MWGDCRFNHQTGWIIARTSISPPPPHTRQVHVMDKLHGEHLHSERACLERHYTGQLQAVQLVSVAG